MKKKAQQAMGLRYHCRCIFSDDQEVIETSSPDATSPDVTSPPRKSARPSVDVRDETVSTPLIPSTISALKFELAEAVNISRVSCSSSDNIILNRNRIVHDNSEFVAALTSRISSLTTEVQTAEEKLRERDREIERILSNLSKTKDCLKSKDNRLHYVESSQFVYGANPQKAVEVLIRQPVDHG